MDWIVAIKHVLTHEGGYVNHSLDRGGETNYGITKAVAEKFGYSGDMRHIPMSVVLAIYKEMYWVKGKCDKLPDELRYSHFDACVNHGVGGASKILQRACGAKDDGIIGSKTLAMVGNATITKLFDERIKYYALIVHRNPTQSVFLSGWLQRAINVRDISNKWYEENCR